MLRVIPPLPPLGRGGHRRSAVWQPWVEIPLWPSQQCGLGRSFCLSEAEVFILIHSSIIPCWKRTGEGGVDSIRENEYKTPAQHLRSEALR